MSPKMQSLQDVDMMIVTVDPNKNYGGSSNDQAVGHLYRLIKLKVRNLPYDNPTRLLWLRPLKRRLSRNRSQNS